MVNTNMVLSSTLFSQTIDWNIKHFFHSASIHSSFELKRIGKALTRRKDQMIVENGKKYKRITIKTNCGGVVVRDEVLGEEIKTKNQYYVRAGQLAVSKIDARNGAFGIVPLEADGAIITGNFWVYNVNPEVANIEYLVLLLSSDAFVNAWQDCSNGSGNRLYLQEEKFLNYKVPMPDIDIQDSIINKYNNMISKINEKSSKKEGIILSKEEYLYSTLGIKRKNVVKHDGFLHIVDYKGVQQWGYDKISISFPFIFEKYEAFSLLSKPNWFKAIYRGKSPKYDESGKNVILNQKCNRWDEIDVSYAKKVNDEWIKQIDESAFTRENDILINSTGEGTIGRASLVKKNDHIGLLYDSHMLLLRLNENEIEPQLIVDIINSTYGQEQVNMYKSAQATKQTELGIENLKKIKFPLPDISLQIKIVNELNVKKEALKILSIEIETLQLLAKKQFEEAIFSE